MSARRATLKMLATFLIAMTAQTAWAQDPATIGSISYNSTLGAYEIKSVKISTIWPCMLTAQATTPRLSARPLVTIAKD